MPAGYDPPERRATRIAADDTPEDAVAQPPTLHVSQHPAVLHKLAILRDENTEPKKFREVVRELSWLLGYEALADARVRPLTIRTPIEEIEAPSSASGSGWCRSCGPGLGMVDAMLELMPTAQVWHLGPVPRRADAPAGRVLQQAARLGVGRPVPDPRPDARDRRLRDGRDRGPQDVGRGEAGPIKLVNLIAGAGGRRGRHVGPPDVEIHCAALDRQLNEKGYIMPGLGDAGDRQFGTGRSD
jgi:uracil phosphoribosyltransferase